MSSGERFIQTWSPCIVSIIQDLISWVTACLQLKECITSLLSIVLFFCFFITKAAIWSKKGGKPMTRNWSIYALLGFSLHVSLWIHFSFLQWLQDRCNLSLFCSREKYLFKNRTAEVPPNSYYHSLYPKIIQDIEVRKFGTEFSPTKSIRRLVGLNYVTVL